MASSSRASSAFLLLLVIAVTAGIAAASSLRDGFNIKWAPENAEFTSDGNGVALKLLSPSSGGALRRKDKFLYGSLTARIQFVRGDSAGTVTTLYTSSTGHGHDEIDFEFLGNQSGHPYTIQTNLYVCDVGNKEVVHRRDGHPCLPRLQGESRRGVPRHPAHVCLRDHLGGEELGNAGRPRQDRLVQGTVRRQLPRRQPRCLQVQQWRWLRRHQLPGGGGPRRSMPAQPLPTGADAWNAAEVQDLRLLHRLQEVQGEHSNRVHPAAVLILVGSVDSFIKDDDIQSGLERNSTLNSYGSYGWNCHV